MRMEEILESVRAFDGVLELAPAEGSTWPEIAWGDHFFYYGPDGKVPQREQPYATVVTKNYPNDAESGLDEPGRWRLNIHVGLEAFTELTGDDPRDAGAGAVHDLRQVDVVLPHPIYRAQGWISIINPGDVTRSLAVGLLERAHEDARQRFVRRGE